MVPVPVFYTRYRKYHTIANKCLIFKCGKLIRRAPVFFYTNINPEFFIFLVPMLFRYTNGTSGIFFYLFPLSRWKVPVVCIKLRMRRVPRRRQPERSLRLVRPFSTPVGEIKYRWICTASLFSVLWIQIRAAKIRKNFIFKCNVHSTKLFTKKLQKIIPENFSLLSPVSLTPLYNIHSRLSPRIFEKNRNDPNGILRGQGDTDLRKKPQVENLVSDSR